MCARNAYVFKDRCRKLLACSGGHSGMPVADLHVHTTVSDGTLDPEAVPEIAADAGLEAVAITDHDRINPALDAPVTERAGVTVVNGIELRVEVPALPDSTHRVDLLGYGVDPTPELEAICERIQQDRIERGRAIVECVEDETGVDLDIDLSVGVGRPHVARAIAQSEAELDYTDAFEELIGNDCACYVARDIPDFETGRAALADACSLVGLAHPFRYEDPEAALSLTEHLDAVERFYPYGEDYDPAPVDAVIERHDLVATGGSDAHGEVLGEMGLDREHYDRFRATLPRPTRG